MAKVSTNFNVDKDLKREAQELFSSLGLDLTTAINMFLIQSVREQRIPFEVRRVTMNERKIEALAEYYEMKNNPQEYRRYDSFEEIMQEVLNEAE